MGVDHSYSAGYGIVLEYDDITSDVIEKLQYFPNYSGMTSHQDWLNYIKEQYGDDEEIDQAEAVSDYNGLEDVIEFMCTKYGLQYSTAGSSYSGELCWLLGAITSGGSNDYWFTEVTPDIDKFAGYEEVERKINELKSDLGLDRKLGHYAGMHIY